jgi:hypothetical protein
VRMDTPLCGVGPFVVISQTPFMGAEFPQGFSCKRIPRASS